MVVRDKVGAEEDRLLSLVSFVLRAEHQKRKPGSDAGLMGIGSPHCQKSFGAWLNLPQKLSSHRGHVVVITWMPK